MHSISQLFTTIQNHRARVQELRDMANGLDEAARKSNMDMTHMEWFQREKTRILCKIDYHQGAVDALTPILETMREDRGFRPCMSEPEGYTDLVRQHEDGSETELCVRVNVRFTCREEGSAVCWAVFPPDATDSEIDQVIGLSGHYSGPGRHFAHDASIRRTKTRILVTKYSGLDI